MLYRNKPRPGQCEIFDLGTLSAWALFSFRTACLCELYGYRARDDGTRSSREPELAGRRGSEGEVNNGVSVSHATQRL